MSTQDTTTTTNTTAPINSGSPFINNLVTSVIPDMLISQFSGGNDIAYDVSGDQLVQEWFVAGLEMVKEQRTAKSVRTLLAGVIELGMRVDGYTYNARKAGDPDYVEYAKGRE